MAETASNPTAPTPVMDVVAPPSEKKFEAPAPETDPLDKLVADDQKERQASPTKIDAHEKSAKHQQPAKPKHTDQTHSGAGAAITATVIIVLALAAMATYAYIQTNK